MPQNEASMIVNHGIRKDESPALLPPADFQKSFLLLFT